jgi:N-acetylglucosaminyldiphosphoundecaprenol N-acetyl-beta-D-mannosaminyltransferase
MPEGARETVDRINGTGARIVFLGLGCPKQEICANRHRDSINGLQVCVGAAFDFLSGEKRIEPKWR